MLPGMQGFEVLRQIPRKVAVAGHHADGPWRGRGSNRWLGNWGPTTIFRNHSIRGNSRRAFKPFWRRSTRNSTTAGQRIILATWNWKENARIARCGNRELELTSLEFDILAYS